MKRFPTLITIVALIGAIAITLFLADTALINEEISPVQKELLQLRNEIERLRGIESEYAARRQALDQLATYLTKERNEAERLRQIALEAARRMESGDATVLTDA